MGAWGCGIASAERGRRVLSRLRRALLVVLTVVALGAAVPGTAAAHTDLERSSPEAGSIAPQPPEAVALEFGGTVLSASVEVTDGCGRTVPATTSVNGTSARAEVDPAGSGSGEWVVRWAAVGEDGHEIGGTIPFTVDGAVECAVDGTGTPAETAAPEADTAAGSAEESAAGVDVPASQAADEPAAAQSSPDGDGVPTGALLAVGVVLVAGTGAVVAQRARGRTGSAGPAR